MHTRLKLSAPSAAMSQQQIERLSIGVFLTSSELLVYLALAAVPDMLRFLALIALVSVIILALPGIFPRANAKLVADIRDLIVFDLCAATIGHILLTIDIESTPFRIIATSIFIMKIFRLCWPVKTADGNEYAGWPIIGLFSYRHAQAQAKNGPAVRLFTWDNNTKLTYLAMAVSFPIGAVLADHRTLQLALWASVPMMYQIISAFQMIGDATAVLGASVETPRERSLIAKVAQLEQELTIARAKGPQNEDETKILQGYRESDPEKNYRLVQVAVKFPLAYPPRKPSSDE